MEARFLIYGLIDPRDGQLRYVGKTSRALKQRLTQHVSVARRGQKTHRSHWLRSVLEAGLVPEVVELEEVRSNYDANESEAFFIAYFRSLGCRLTNATDGGEGAPGWRPGVEWRRRRSEFMRGKTYSLGFRPSEATRRRMSESHRGKTTGPHDRARRIKNSRAQGGRAVSDQHGHVYETAAEACRVLGLNQAAVSAVLLGKRKSHHGLQFRFVG